MSRDGRILVVDDEQSNLDLLAGVLARAGYADVDLVSDPVAGLERFAEWRPDLVLLDLHMPGLDGFAVLERFGRLVAGDDLVPVVVLTADSTRAARERALALGAHDFLTKPFDVTEVTLRVANHLRTRALHVRVQRHRALLEEEVAARTRDLEAARLELLSRLGLASEYRDDATHRHTVRVGLNTGRLARALGLPGAEADVLEGAAPLHDIGKIGVSDTVLLKAGLLTEAERAGIRAHAEIGGRILAGSCSEVLRRGEEIALTHHEHWDGTGYPRGLRRSAIPLSGRLVAVVDVFDALTHERPYKPAWPAERAADELRHQRGLHFDPEVVDAFLGLVAADRVVIDA